MSLLWTRYVTYQSVQNSHLLWHLYPLRRLLCAFALAKQRMAPHRSTSTAVIGRDGSRWFRFCWEEPTKASGPSAVFRRTQEVEKPRTAKNNLNSKQLGISDKLRSDSHRVARWKVPRSFYGPVCTSKSAPETSETHLTIAHVGYVAQNVQYCPRFAKELLDLSIMRKSLSPDDSGLQLRALRHTSSPIQSGDSPRSQQHDQFNNATQTPIRLPARRQNQPMHLFERDESSQASRFIVSQTTLSSIPYSVNPLQPRSPYALKLCPSNPSLASSTNV